MHDVTGRESPSPAALSVAGDEISLGIAVHRPKPMVAVVVVTGEIDMVTSPQLEKCLREQLALDTSHLVVDLAGVSFLGSNGLAALLAIGELVTNTDTTLHLAGLDNRHASRPLEVTGLLPRFVTHPTGAEALAAIGD